MARRCAITGKAIQFGNNVSHSQRKTRRRFNPNIHSVSLLSDLLAQHFKLNITASTLRTIEHNGGLDSYLLGTSNLKLSKEAIVIKKQIKKAQPIAA
jgi:large subunit ribosomal protein L28